MDIIDKTIDSLESGPDNHARSAGGTSVNDADIQLLKQHNHKANSAGADYNREMYKTGLRCGCGHCSCCLYVAMRDKMELSDRDVYPNQVFIIARFEPADAEYQEL